MTAAPNNIPADALEANLDSSVSILYPLFQKMWDEAIPEEWKEEISSSFLQKKILVIVPTIEV